MDRLELLVEQGALNQLRKARPVMEEQLPVAEAVHHRVGRRRNVGCSGGRAAGRTDPVLGATEFSWGGLVASHASHQPFMELADEAQGEWQLAQTLEAVLQRLHIVLDFPQVCVTRGV